MEYTLSKVLVALLISTLALPCCAQQVAPLSKKAAAIKRKADNLTPQTPISVVRVHAEEEFGNFLSNNQEGFTFYDVDRKADVTLKYADVRKERSKMAMVATTRFRRSTRIIREPSLSERSF